MDFLTLGRKIDDSKSINVLIVTDHFTKYVQAYVSPEQTAVIVAKTLWENFLVHYGWPEKILTAQGKSFEKQFDTRIMQVSTSKITMYQPLPSRN